MSEDTTRKFARRDFLRSLGAGAGLAAVAAVTVSREAAATETPKEAKKTRYNANSDEVKTYYRVNRY